MEGRSNPITNNANSDFANSLGNSLIRILGVKYEFLTRKNDDKLPLVNFFFCFHYYDKFS